MQELVSILSIILGVVVLTAWVMWILLRPSGDSKTQQFASESARDGLTLTVIENNELKNKIMRLERELKVLTSAGFGKEKNISEKLKVESGELQDERSGTKDTGRRIKDEGLRIKDEGENHSEMPKAERVETRDEGLRTKDEREDFSEKLKVESLKGEDEYLKVETEVAVPKPVEFIQSSDVAALSEAQRVTDEAEKKKIADYLACVAEATERQMKEVEALGGNHELTEEMQEYPDDDLKKIKGIGLHLEVMLKKAGIHSHQQIAEFTEEDIQRISKQIGFFPRRINRDAWVMQAKELLNKG